MLLSLFVLTAISAPDLRVTIEPATDRPGGEFRSLPAVDAYDCRNLCESEGRCKAFTFRDERCSLKTTLANAVTATNSVSGVRAQFDQLTVLTVNVSNSATLHAMDGFDDSWKRRAKLIYGADVEHVEDANWIGKVDRLSDAIAATSTPPDIISITETEGWRSCNIVAQNVDDYQLQDYLIQKLAVLTGVNYRLAYMTGATGAFRSGVCRYYSGDAVLYDPVRLVNRNVDDAYGFPQQQAHDGTLVGFQQRRSLPICYGSASPEMRDRIDGAPQNDRCNRGVPSGPAWALIYESEEHELAMPASAIRFSFAHDRRWSFDVFTMHPQGSADRMPEMLVQFAQGLATPPYRIDRPFYRPLLIGDLNTLAGDGASISGFSQVFGAPQKPTSCPGDPNECARIADVMVVRTGDPETFPALNDYEVASTAYLPVDPTRPFSDHVALMTTFRWKAPPEQPEPFAPSKGGCAHCSDVVADRTSSPWLLIMLLALRSSPRHRRARGLASPR